MPVSVFAKAVGMTVSSSGGNIRLTGGFKPILSASKFYREDEVFWLARIIHAESRGEPLLGQIAVGSVVMNRVKSNYYPNTIYGVIFDRKYGVQFSPVLDGSIYNTPGYTSTLAAKICLEGYDVTGGAFFFLAPDLATSSWIPRTREYAFTVGGHDFYF
jgi:N-acetylmuramoyl-L-alanine amidase